MVTIPCLDCLEALYFALQSSQYFGIFLHAGLYAIGFPQVLQSLVPDWLSSALPEDSIAASGSVTVSRFEKSFFRK
ncbi:MAG: hypothetical protein J6D38_06505, partial [Solobacterium sp.]|nr:hypothetical protein [Solobacterium sp.]